MAHERLSRYTSAGQFEEASGRMRQAYGRAQEAIVENPGYSALACFGIGLCAGAAVTLLLTSPKKEKAWYESYLPDEGFAGDITRQVREAVANVVPEAVARYLKRR